MYNYLKHLAKQFLYKSRSFNYKITYLKNRTEKIIIFQSFHGSKYNDSPKAIFLEMLLDDYFNDYEFYWAIDNPNKLVVDDNRVKTVEYGSKQYLEIVSKSKYIITSTRLLNYIQLRNEQKYIQTWHGTPLKKLGADITYTTNKRTSVSDYKLMNKLDSYKIDYFISPSSYASSKFKSAFDLDDKQILEIGYPRNDFLVNYTEQDIKRIKENLNLPDDKQIILYAPTWRDDSYSIKDGYIDNSPISLEELTSNLPNHIILYRSHYMSKANEAFDNVIDVSSYNEINDLFIIADLLITDYSSVFFDYAILKKPAVFYMYDLEKYENETRGFYFDVHKTLYGPIVKTKAELLQVINNPVVYDNYEEFYKQFCINEDGNATKRLIDTIKSEK